MKSFFFSLKTSFTLFVLLAVVFGVGSSLAQLSDAKAVFKHMTATHLFHCLEVMGEVPLVASWVLLLILVSIALFINVVCCTSSQLRSLFKFRHKRLRMGFMAAIHLVAILVLILHGLDVLLVNRHEPIKLHAGEAATMGEYQVRVLEVTYSASPLWVTEDQAGKKINPMRFSRDDFSKGDNRARIEISAPGLSPQVREIALLSPVRMGATFFFLETFFIAHGDSRVGVEIHYSYNPLAPIFFGTYMVLFLLMMVQFFITMREKEETHDEFY